MMVMYLMSLKTAQYNFLLFCSTVFDWASSVEYRCNGHQILLDPRVKRAVNLTGVARVGEEEACLLIVVLPGPAEN